MILEVIGPLLQCEKFRQFFSKGLLDMLDVLTYTCSSPTTKL
jgi:hypothetical protein